MADLWVESRARSDGAVAPLAVRMRPRTLAEFAGQEHILGEGKLLRRMLQADAITSLILHGPPGTGKTTLAELVASHSRRHFERENAASVGVKRVREIIDEASLRLQSKGQRTILFLDEIHRFTRAQQDVLLGDVERGVLTLIGATTENPIFACNSALVSRSTLFRLEPLGEREIVRVVRAAIADAERGYGALDVRVSDEALRVWAIKCDGDARRALTALEVAVLSSQASLGGSDGGKRQAIVIDRRVAEDSIQQKAAAYDAGGDEHFDTISAMIKSIRGSDPDAAVYWIARMLEAGEDPRYIARRLAILASEDIGNADPRAIMVASAAWELVERIGMPEARITLAQAATYLAVAPKSNAAYVAIDEALADVRDSRTLPVPVYLRDKNSSPVADAEGKGVRVKESGGESYVYSHDVPGAITGQGYLGVDKRYYRPGDAGSERAIAERLEAIRRLRRQGRDG
ncbi:MAG: replication-associated recombination protein A [Phycisphaerae bacterium]|nr:replication-associated recombination protein A [Phycisphaerae bacterium]